MNRGAAPEMDGQDKRGGLLAIVPSSALAAVILEEVVEHFELEQSESMSMSDRTQFGNTYHY